jgi:hypothetical protein
VLFIDLPINLAILEIGVAFRVKRNPLSQVIIQGNSKEGEDAYNNINKEEDYKGEDAIDLYASPARLVAIIDLIAENADFISLE